ncbi:PadR family transcriptional regulator [Nonomuraea sp. SBT364]|uniref:PadR family transcriptional regulator n=1 Tax=Nonomuraea sp. SBT364 TaxID=1580530 RepID=UPI00066A7E8E|nr:PadR family transcriptional regulator [Nonomuraea sp. SBT364]
MASRESVPRSALGLIVLGLLTEEPMHVYRMQKLIEQYGKARVVNVRRRASLYQTVERLARHGLVEARESVSGDGVPDRIVYAVTAEGRETGARWLREMLSTTGAEFPEFLAALSVLAGLAPDAALRHLRLRADRLAADLAATEAIMNAEPRPPRLFLLEEECRQLLLRTELEWVRGVVEDLGAGRLAWDEPWRLAVRAEFVTEKEE